MAPQAFVTNAYSDWIGAESDLQKVNNTRAKPSNTGEDTIGKRVMLRRSTVLYAPV